MVVERRGRALLAAAAAALVVLAVGGCSTRAPGQCDTGQGTLVVGLVAPLSGELAPVGLGMRNSADLAVRQANESCTVPGYRLELQPRDDRADADTGAAAAAAFVKDPAVIGVLGPFNSSVAQKIQPVLADAGIVQISPGNTSTQLTRGANPVTAPLRQYQTYFRTVATDAVQGPAAATFLAASGRKKVAVVSDGKTYGEGIAGEFGKQLATLGGQVVSRTQLPPGSPPAAAVAAVERSRPDAVFYGGEYPDGGPLSRALGAAGINAPLLGGDGIVNPDYVRGGGRDGDLGTSVGPPPETMPTARGFVQGYTQAGYREGSGSYGAFTYDAANVLLRATATVLESEETWSPARRPALVRGVQAFSGDGATGPISFDQYGDATVDAVTVYRVAGGAWVPVRPAT